jgi:exodeoxyribonuclease X
MKAILLDTETTDASPDCEVIELAMAEVENPLTPPTMVQVTRFVPTRRIIEGSLNTHHIILDDLLHADPPCQPSASAKLDEAVRFVVGHNIDFDWHAVGEPPVKRICTLALA